MKKNPLMRRDKDGRLEVEFVKKEDMRKTLYDLSLKNLDKRFGEHPSNADLANDMVSTLFPMCVYLDEYYRTLYKEMYE